MIKAVIFDMDGLMFDTEALALNAWKNAAEKFNCTITDEIMAKMRGIDLKHCQEVFETELGTDVDFYDVRSAAVAYMVEYVDANGVPVKDGLNELLAYIKKRGFKIALATSTENKRAIYYLTTANVLNYFNKIICGDMVERGKPDPDIYLKAISSLGLRAEECIALEDSPNGTIAAHRANCPVIIVPDLDKIEDNIKEAAFDVAKDLYEVIEKLEVL